MPLRTLELEPSMASTSVLRSVPSISRRRAPPKPAAIASFSQRAVSEDAVRPSPEMNAAISL